MVLAEGRQNGSDTSKLPPLIDTERGRAGFMQLVLLELLLSGTLAIQWLAPW